MLCQAIRQFLNVFEVILSFNYFRLTFVIRNNSQNIQAMSILDVEIFHKTTFFCKVTNMLLTLRISQIELCDFLFCQYFKACKTHSLMHKRIDDICDICEMYFLQRF